MNAQLLKTYVWDMDLTGRIPLFMEFRVDPRVTPFLVTSTSSLIWLSKTRNGMVRAAVRSPIGNIKDFYMEVIQEVCDKGLSSKWGNVHPLTKSGIQSALEHLHSYGFEKLDVLVHPTLPVDFDVPEQAEVIQVDWLKEGYLVIIPRDREFVGFVSLLGNHIVSVIHNASRGIAIARLTHEEVAKESVGNSEP